MWFTAFRVMIVIKKYVGETIQKLGERVKQHKASVISRTNKDLTALAYHSKFLDHQFNFDQVEILATENNKQKLRIKEVQQIILKENLCCNFKQDSQSITPIFYNLIKQHKTASNY